MAMSADRSCSTGQWRLEAFAQAWAGIGYSLTDRRVCAARIAFSAQARGPGVPALIHRRHALSATGWPYHLRAAPEPGSPPTARPLRGADQAEATRPRSEG